MIKFIFCSTIKREICEGSSKKNKKKNMKCESSLPKNMKCVKGFLKKHEIYEGSPKLHEMCDCLRLSN